MSCEHAFCDICVRIYGKEDTDTDYLYQIKCTLCRFGNLTVKLKPVTAGERILSIDGGGPRGVIPLEFLAIIQEMMGPVTLVQELFDVAFGTSVGRFRQIAFGSMLTLQKVALSFACSFYAGYRLLNVFSYLMTWSSSYSIRFRVPGTSLNVFVFSSEVGT
jgi:hypothetical protein